MKDKPAPTTLKFARKPYLQATLKAGRRRIALKRLLKRSQPHPFSAPVENGFSVLVHKSTKKRGWWQATFFDRDGEPWSDAENSDWYDLLEHIHMDGVDWHHVKPL